MTYRGNIGLILCCSCFLSVFALGTTAQGNAAELANSPASTPARSVVDVELQAGGILRGQLLNTQGVPQAQGTVLLIDEQSQRRTQCDAHGHFTFREMTTGTHRLVVGDQAQLVQAWAPGTAPPSANPRLLLIKPQPVIRGQRVAGPGLNNFVRKSKRALANPLVFSGVVATAVAIPVAIHNTDDDPATP